MPFDSRKQQQWYHATDQTYLDDEPHEARKVKGENEYGDKDLTTTAGQDINPEDKNMETPIGSAREVTQEEKELKRGEMDDEQDDLISFEGKLYKAIEVDQHCEKCANLGVPCQCDDEATEEGIASVSGPPADSNMNVMGSTITLKKEEENLTDEDLTSDNLTDYTLEESLMFEGFEFYPARKGHVEKVSDIIFENRLYTCESLGNCEFCGGKGKVTVERRGLKDCPDCDGTGDIAQENPIPNVIGDMQDPSITEDPAQQTAQDQIPQQPTGLDPEQLPQTQPEQPKKKEGESKAQEDYTFGDDVERKETSIEDLWETSNRAQRLAILNGVGYGADNNLGGDVDKYRNERDELLDKPYSELPFMLQNFVQKESVDRLKGLAGAAGWMGESKAQEFQNDICPRCHSSDVQFGEDYPSECNQCGWKRNATEARVSSSESCGCKQKAQEASISKYKDFIATKIKILKTHAKAGESVSLMYGLPTLSKQGKKIKGTLAYAGVSLNDRIYLPEELAKGHGKTLPLLLNHSNVAGAEEELDRLDDNMKYHLENEEDYQVGEVTLTWDPEQLTLFYEGVIDHEFFQKEVDDMDMAVSLGIYYDSDSPTICDDNCYTVIKGAEFREVSLVYHAGFPIATIEAVEAELKKNARKAQEDHFVKLAQLQEEEQAEGEKEHVKDVQDIIADVEEETVPKEAEEELDNLLPTGQPIDVEEKPIMAESLMTNHNFSVRGVAGMTVSNSNGVERYTLDPNMSYETNMVHFDVSPKGAQIYGEEMQLSPKMTTPPDLTKEIENKPNINFTDSDSDAFKKKQN